MKGSPRKDCKGGGLLLSDVAADASMKGSPRKDCKSSPGLTP